MIAFPIRFDGSGHLATVADYSPQAARQLTHGVVATRPGERPLAPAYGTPDPSDGVDPGIVGALVALCEPELSVRAVTVSGQQADVDAEWSQA